VRFPLNLGGYLQESHQIGIRCHDDMLITIANIMGVSAAQVQASGELRGASASADAPASRMQLFF
jgi:hypothetical protein